MLGIALPSLLWTFGRDGGKNGPSDRNFKVKQHVDFVAWDFRPMPLGRSETVRVLPVEHGIHRYRIKSVTDGQERVVVESELA